MEREYAQAVLEVAKRGMQPKELVKNLENTLRSRGHLQLSHKIAHALREAERRMGRGSESTLTIAKESEVASAKAEAAEHIDTNAVRIVTDDSLIGGWVLATPNTRVDASFKKQLLDLYQKITA